MPVLLQPHQVRPLEALLKQVPVHGLNWQIEGNAAQPIAGLGTLQAAGPQEIAFLSSARYAAQLRECRAAAVVLTPEAAQEACAHGEPAFARIVTPHPYLLYARLAQWFDAQLRPPQHAEVHPTAVVSPEAILAADVAIGPHAVIGPGARLEAGVRVGAGCTIGANCQIGEHSLLHPRVTLYHDVRVGKRVILHSGVVLGADGFGFAPDALAPANERGRWVKIPQLGGVSIGDDVEIGANTTIDRGALDDTVVEQGVKLDDQIMVGHNVRIGAHTAIAACTGIAGSTTIGARCQIGGAAMIGGHLQIVDDVVISGGTSVPSSVTAPGQYTSLYPLAEHAEWQRNAAVVPQLSRLRKQLRALERRLPQAEPDT